MGVGLATAFFSRVVRKGLRKPERGKPQGYGGWEEFQAGRPGSTKTVSWDSGGDEERQGCGHLQRRRQGEAQGMRLEAGGGRLVHGPLL